MDTWVCVAVGWLIVASTVAILLHEIAAGKV
jgi:hypothetical protein